MHPSVKTKNSVSSTTTVTPDQKHIFPAFALPFSEKIADTISSAVHITGPIMYAQMHRYSTLLCRYSDNSYTQIAKPVKAVCGIFD